MSKVIRYKRNGINICGVDELKDQEDVYELCNKCKRRNKDVANKDCHARQKIQQVATLFSVTAPIFSCPSFSGEVIEPVIEDITSKQTDPDSTEGDE